MPHKKTIYFVRHGQSVDNASPVFQAVSSPLSSKGIAQAESVAERLSGLHYDTLISSPVLRARQTAEAIAARSQQKIIFNDLFVERIKPIEIDGKAWTDATATKIWREWEISLYTPGLKVSNGENYEETIVRVDKALAYLENLPGESIVVVTHGYFLRAMIIRILVGSNLNGPIMKYFQEHASIENTAVTIVDYRDAFEEDFAWRLRSLNDHSHVG